MRMLKKTFLKRIVTLLPLTKQGNAWEHLNVIASNIYHQPQTGIGMLNGRNIPTVFQPLEVICGEPDKPRAEKK